MRGKLDGDRFARGQGEFLFDLGQVSMFGDAVGADAFVAFGIQKRNIGFATGTAHAAEAIGDDAGGLDQAGFQQRCRG